MSDAMINLIVAIIEIAVCIALVILYLKLANYKIDLEFAKEIEKLHNEALKGWTESATFNTELCEHNREIIELNGNILNRNKEINDKADKILRMGEMITKSQRIYLDFMKGDEADGQD